MIMGKYSIIVSLLTSIFFYSGDIIDVDLASGLSPEIVIYAASFNGVILIFVDRRASLKS